MARQSGHQSKPKKPADAPPAENKLIDSARLMRLGLILALAGVGYLLGPADLARGDYQAEVHVAYRGMQFAATLPFQVSGSNGESQTATDLNEGYALVVEGQGEFPYALDRRISYRAQLQDQQGHPVDLELQDFSSSIVGSGYEQALPATDSAEGWMLFSMRIPFNAKVITSLLFAVAGLWLTELVPLAAASLLIPVVAALAGVAGEATVYQSFFHPIVVLFFAGFLLAEGMRHTGVDRVIALSILRRSSMNPLFLMLTMMLVTAFFSLWMSNTASVALMIPIALAVLNRIPQEGERTGFRRALILGVAYSATVGGIGSAIGTPANILALDFLNQFTGADMSFADWFPFGLPMVAVMIPVIWVYLMISYGVRTQKVSPHLTRDVYKIELKELGPLDAAQKILILVLPQSLVCG